MDNRAKEIVEALRDAGWTNPGTTDKQSLEYDAADLIEAQAAEIERLNNANSQLDGANDSLMRSNKALADEVKRLTAERDAAKIFFKEVNQYGTIEH